MENRTEKTKRIMANVMAALHTFGIEYNTNVTGYRVERSLSELVKEGEETVDYIEFNVEDNFKTKFKEFIEKPHYYIVSGAYWANDDKYVVIQLSRLYEMDDKYWNDYANWYGCKNPM